MRARCLSELRNLLSSGRQKAFCEDDRGGITIYVMVFFILMLVVGGMAVDYQRFDLARADLQNALDRGVLAATNENQDFDPNGSLSIDEQATQLINSYLASRIDNAHTVNLAATVTQNGGTRTVLVGANQPIDTIFLRMIGITQLPVVAQSGAIYSAPKLEITLVLDVSGSMDRDSSSAPGTKLEQLQVAAKEFIDTVLDADSEAEVLISIVPYSMQVNMPRAMADLYNIDRHHDYASCIDFHEFDFTTTAMPMNPVDPYEQNQRFIEDAGDMDYACPRTVNAITPYSNDANALKAAIDALTPEKWTAIYLGMKWGAALLDPSSRPIVDAMIANNEISADYAGWPHAWNDPSVRKIVVLMSDGKNTKYKEMVPGAYASQSPAYWNVNAPTNSQKITIIDNDNSVQTDNDGSRRGQGDRLLKDICDAAKADPASNATIYTIGFELDGEELAINALENCASSLSTHYLVDGVEISTAFQNIADEIVELKLTH